ncbi:envelope stress response membrane protein PspC [Luteithermobacter gelatinilyticus]|uniref:envelope stress response membrane protein PspC n=1 Tax=Luteithermobacter gelatinilyticus TaxID=2582913 RepID=UPI0011066912|nr:envelope stress response membrane protein PspC [Luteithermobacter gelatinilyticus]|tara:strand:+ start:5759 stop:6169 length:411 start_codon:yes stop_codon:yes gene_type:complete
MSRYRDPHPPRYNKFYLDKRNGKIAGVCAGLADYFGLDVTLIRIVTLICLFFFGPVILVGYILLAWLVDPRPDDLFHSEKESEFWKNVRVKPHNTVRDIRHKFREIERRLRAAEAHITSREYKLQKEFRDLEDNNK